MKLNNKLSIILLSSVALTSCSDLDNQDNLSGQLTGEQIEESISAIPSRVEAQVIGMYSIMSTPLVNGGNPSTRDDDAGYFTNCFSQDQNGADVVTSDNDYNWFSASAQLADRSDLYANPYMRYYSYYQQIKLANDVIKTIDPATTNETLKGYYGQALAIRAFDYLGVIPYFQFNYATSKELPGVPLVDENTIGNSRPRATVEAVYDFILKDLNSSLNFFKNYTRSNKSEVNSAIVYGLRARAELNMERYAEAALSADSAIMFAAKEGIAPASREAVSHPAFCKLSEQNWMWGTSLNASMLTSNHASNATPASWISSFAPAGYGAATGTYARINTLLYNKIPSTDVRKSWWLNDKKYSSALEGLSWSYTYKDEDGNTNSGTAKGQEIVDLKYDDKAAMDPYTNVKFGMKSGIGSSTNDNDYPMMRIEEMYLIKAEALGMSGQLAEGKTTLEYFVKNYRDASYVCMANTTQGFQNEIWKQRRIELWGEGFSLSDIMRLNKPVVRFNSTDGGLFPDNFRFNIAPHDGWLLLRFPQKETNNNVGLTKADNNNEGSQPEPDQNIELKDGVTD